VNARVLPPRFSVVVPCFRQARLLPDALRSVAAQADIGLEIIVVDDGSDDDVASACNPFAGLVTYVRQNNQGLSKARNAGLQHARGDFVQFVDSDDAVTPGFYQAMLQALTANPQALLAAGRGLFCDEDLRPFGPSLEPPASGNWFRELARGNTLHVSAVVCRRGIVSDVGGFDSRVDECADWDLWLRIARTGALMLSVPSCATLYRQHPSAMSRNAVRMYRAIETVLARARTVDERIQGVASEVPHIAPPDELRRLLNANAIFYTVRALTHGYADEAIELLRSYDGNATGWLLTNEELGDASCALAYAAMEWPPSSTTFWNRLLEPFARGAQSINPDDSAMKILWQLGSHLGDLETRRRFEEVSSELATLREAYSRWNGWPPVKVLRGLKRLIRQSRP
jgi:glycosyltransferase involved in cell wall biosynthesis